jgi:peptidoglycan/LPS O-acetylase OafA/YrhL
MVAITYLMYAPDTNVFRKMYMNLGLALSAALLVFCTARYRKVVSRLLNSPPALVLGDASYSINLVHYVMLIATKLIGRAVHEHNRDASSVDSALCLLRIARAQMVAAAAPGQVPACCGGQ